MWCGAAQRGAEANNIESSAAGTVKLQDISLVRGADGKPIVMSRSAELTIVNEQDAERARYRLPYGGKLFFEDGDAVNPGDILIEWDPYTIPIITELEGVANYVDLTDGVSVREVADEATGLSVEKSSKVSRQVNQPICGHGLPCGMPMVKF